jgi:hypothetical protein
MALVREQTMPTERTPLVNEVSANFFLTDRRCRMVSVTDSQRPYSRFSRLEQLLVLPSSSSIVLMRLSGPYSRHTTSQEIW